MEGKVWAAADVLRSARPWLDDARNQLRRKISDDAASMNVFLVVHPLDYVTTESFRNYVPAGQTVPMPTARPRSARRPHQLSSCTPPIGMPTHGRIASGALPARRTVVASGNPHGIGADKGQDSAVAAASE